MRDYKFLLTRVIPRWVGCMFLPIYLAFYSGSAAAIYYIDISNSYSNCRYQDNGNGTSTISTTIDYKSAKTGGGSTFNSRSVLLYIYDKYGSANNKLVASSLSLNGVGYSKSYAGINYSMYYGKGATSWKNESAFLADISVVVDNKLLSAWPALSIQAGAFTSGYDVAEIKGGAYIAKDRSNGGACIVITDPGNPPPLDIDITVFAPDWNLGELQQGQSDTTFGHSDQQLCFSYSAADLLSEKLVISASNVNGVVNNRYQLRHLSDTSQVVPYSLTLDSGSKRLQLPNNSTALQLDGNRTCFVPTFRTEVGKTVKDGDYNDVLNFTITTKS